MMPHMREIGDQIETEAINSVRKSWGKFFQRRYYEGRIRLCQRREEGCADFRGNSAYKVRHMYNTGSFRKRCKTGAIMGWGI